MSSDPNNATFTFREPQFESANEHAEQMKFQKAWKISPPNPKVQHFLHALS